MRPGDVTLAFLASGIEGIKVRITARARTLGDVTALLDKEESEVRRAIAERLGDIVFGVDEESMEVAVAARLVARGLSFGVAESLTGGLIASRLVNVPGASKWFRGGVVAYDSQVKFDVLGGARRAGGDRAGRGGHGRGCSSGDRRRRRVGDHRGRRSRRAGGRGPRHSLRRDSACPGSPPRPANFGSRATASACGSTGQLPPSTCSDERWTTFLPDRPGGSQEAHSRVTLDGYSRTRP